ncbi:hypothetical protein [Pseudanabaena sp. FACHB-2040]|uniref:hypothetical protein n=1 Tax=Pseudanabaena sp. FACHB-2040 TaxID=2692859 RepID=UPI001685672C|nr:hypothetical protein [Pseudanabaena sp. FACHB-2040]MBD2257841.1 hypothetical protein [Pseudanabaena sp. FACHB-2040]
MAVKPIQYEMLLSFCTEHQGALELLRQYRPYLEAIPSMRRPQDSIVTLPLPNVRVREAAYLQETAMPVTAGAAVTLPCDVAFLMCDPEWKVKTGVEIFVFIHRPNEDFADLLMRWRKTQILLDGGHEWLLPQRYQHLLSDGAESAHPLFVVFPQTPKRIVQGLRGAALPVVVHPLDEAAEALETSDPDLELDLISGLEDIDASGLEIPDSE